MVIGRLFKAIILRD